MRINCPHCGLRDVIEFSYAGDANRTRPDLASTDTEAWNSYVFDRINTRGKHREFWQHNHGCRAYLIVQRDSVSHEIFSVELARKSIKGKSLIGESMTTVSPKRKAAKQ